MPKKAGQDMPPIKHSPPLRPTPRPINHQTPPAPGPHHRGLPSTPGAPSNAEAAKTIRATKNPGSINPKQQVY